MEAAGSSETPFHRERFRQKIYVLGNNPEETEGRAAEIYKELVEYLDTPNIHHHMHSLVLCCLQAPHKAAVYASMARSILGGEERLKNSFFPLLEEEMKQTVSKKTLLHVCAAARFVSHCVSCSVFTAETILSLYTLLLERAHTSQEALLVVLKTIPVCIERLYSANANMANSFWMQIGALARASGEGAVQTLFDTTDGRIKTMDTTMQEESGGFEILFGDLELTPNALKHTRNVSLFDTPQTEKTLLEKEVVTELFVFFTANYAVCFQNISACAGEARAEIVIEAAFEAVFYRRKILLPFITAILFHWRYIEPDILPIISDAVRRCYENVVGVTVANRAAVERFAIWTAHYISCQENMQWDWSMFVSVLGQERRRLRRVGVGPPERLAEALLRLLPRRQACSAVVHRKHPRSPPRIAVGVYPEKASAVLQLHGNTRNNPVQNTLLADKRAEAGQGGGGNAAGCVPGVEQGRGQGRCSGAVCSSPRGKDIWTHVPGAVHLLASRQEGRAACAHTDVSLLEKLSAVLRGRRWVPDRPGRHHRRELRRLGCLFRRGKQRG
ncbi:MAG: uncharacterized protein A8A55_2352 [Amphiamblys sp. WSBS2006]|nr:MAG: uncharacterized protein A8A55_2352 [Amphiamblys sp. WSBS2006]